MSETVTIASLAHRGDGVCETAAGPLYVPFTLPGEVVRVEGRGERARLVGIETPSADRVTPPCRHFGTCGGCALQHMEHSAYAAWKRAQVTAALDSRGLKAAVEPMIAAEPGSRRRAVFTAARAGGRVLVGYHERASNRLVQVEQCAVVTPAIAAALPLLRRLGDLAAPKRGEVRLTVLDTQAGLDVAIDGAGKGAAKLFPKLGQMAFEADLARLSLDGEVVIEARPPALNMDGVAVVPGPGGFTQASAQAEAAMAERVLGALNGARQVLDLYSGIGTFALRIARTAPVHAVESDRAALKALDAAWRRSNGLKAISHEARDLARRPLMRDELEKFDAVVFDPPRAGARAQCEMLAASDIKTIVAVSCNPATLARDLRILVDGGYTIESVLPVDQFLFSPHIEVVAILKRE